MDDQQTHNCDSDEQLDAMLHRLFIIEGHEEVTVQHPTEGEQVMTKKYYLELQESLRKANSMSPAERLVETAKLRNKKQLQFRTAMIEAKHYVIDLDDEKSFGYDVNGIKIDIEGMNFVPADQYIKGVEVLKDELGAFVSENMLKPPVRLFKKPSIFLDMCTHFCSSSASLFLC